MKNNIEKEIGITEKVEERVTEVLAGMAGRWGRKSGGRKTGGKVGRVGVGLSQDHVHNMENQGFPGSESSQLNLIKLTYSPSCHPTIDLYVYCIRSLSS